MKQFNINSNNLTNFFFSFENYDRARYNKDWKSFEHMHAFSEIFFVTDGKGVLRTKSKDYHIHKGMVIFINPMTIHTELSDAENHLEYAVFAVKNLTFSKNNSDESQQVFIFDLTTDFDFLFDVIRVIEDEDVQKRPFWKNAIMNEFNKFMVFILRKKQLLSLPFHSSEQPNTISNIHNFLTSNYQDDITLDKIANLFFLNKYYLAHAYKKKYGVSIIKDLNIIRCNEAKTLLKTTNLPISEIALSVGYNSISHFSGTYKDIIKETPQKTRSNFFNSK